MRLARVEYDGSIHLARIDDVAVLLCEESSHPAADVLREAIYSGVSLTGPGLRVGMDEVRLLAPVANPSKFLGVGLNYRAHAAESGLAVPLAPTLFAKTTNTIVGPSDQITYRTSSTAAVDFEVELAIVIGATACNASPEEARSAILGFTVCNDVTARDAQFGDAQWVRSKSFDTFGPLGPVIVSPDELGETPLRLTTRLNGALMQDATTDDMIFSPQFVVEYISRTITLVPGDVITTGTPVGVGFARKPPVYVADGDVIEVAIAGIGSCTNKVTVLRGMGSSHNGRSENGGTGDSHDNQR